MNSRPERPGALVISLDFELHWGVRDRLAASSPYEANLRGARDVVLRSLRLFEEMDIAATWATVGFLFARNRDELLTYRPRVLPAYADPRLDPYGESIGADEDEDPLHFGASLVERIRTTPRQEIGTHTFSHYFCMEAGQTLESFRADLEAACAIAAARDIPLRSIVFPRNQHNPAYATVLREAGIVAYRGNPDRWMWRFIDGAESRHAGKRAARMVDAYLPAFGDPTTGWDEVIDVDGLANVRASFPLRPWTPRLRSLERLRLERLRRAIIHAARTRRVVHVWWHPHTFGAHPAQSLAFVRAALETFDDCRRRYGMRSLTMAEVADAAPGRSEPAAAFAGTTPGAGAG
ncbi:MAG TPA: hypothetical protein VFU06_09200 [Longimicrobiales bacterium]|nr:hypothetical protein [Longimicrobiales bacterium]